MLFLGWLSWDIFKKDKLDIVGIPDRLSGREVTKSINHVCIYPVPPPPQITFFKTSQAKQIARPEKKQVANNPLSSVHFRPSPIWTIGISSKLVVGVVDDEMDIPCHNGSLVTHGRSRPTGFQLSRKLVPPTSSWKWMLPKMNHRVDRVMQGSIDDSEMLWNVLRNTKPFIQARPLLN